MVCNQAIRKSHDDETLLKPGQLVVPDHGSSEVGKGLENKILKAAGLKQAI